MKEQLIEYSTAVLAKEKGCKFSLFDNSWTYKDEHGDVFVCNFKPRVKKGRFDIKRRSKWTQALLQKWIREKYGIHMEVIPDESDPHNKWYAIVYPLLCMNEPENIGEYPTYEQALEQALKEALNLIKTQLT